MAERFELVEKAILKMVEDKKYATLRDILLTMNPADIAGIFNSLDDKRIPLMFRLLPKELAAETFVEMETEDQELLINFLAKRDGWLKITCQLGIGWVEGSEILCVASVQPGAGERVLRTLLTLIDSDRAELEVVSTNTRAIRLYERMGFVTVGESMKWHQIF